MVTSWVVGGWIFCNLLHCCTIVHTWWVMGRFLVSGWYYYTTTAALLQYLLLYMVGSWDGLDASAVVVLTRVYVASPHHTLSAACSSFDYRLPPYGVAAVACYERRAGLTRISCSLKNQRHILTYLYCDTPCSIFVGYPGVRK